MKNETNYFGILQNGKIIAQRWQGTTKVLGSNLASFPQVLTFLIPVVVFHALENSQVIGLVDSTVLKKEDIFLSNSATL